MNDALSEWNSYTDQQKAEFAQHFQEWRQHHELLKPQQTPPAPPPPKRFQDMTQAEKKEFLRQNRIDPKKVHY